MSNDAQAAEQSQQLFREFEVQLNAGNFDSKIVDVIGACGKRLESGPTEQKWTLTWEGEVFREDEMTLDEICRAEDLAGTSWAALKPIWKGGYLRALLRAFLEHRQGMPESVSKKVVGSMTRDAALDIIGMVEVEAPKAVSESDEDVTS